MLYFAYVGLFFGDMPPPLLTDTDEDMVEVAAGHSSQPHIPLDMWYRPYLRYRMEMCDRLSAFLVGAGVLPIEMRDIMDEPDLLQLWI